MTFCTPRPIWLDTDPGFDDWLTWALLAAQPQLALQGVSVVAGNAPLATTLDNALRIRAAHGWSYPVHAGCERPLVQAPYTAQRVLGASAMASNGRHLPPTGATPDSHDGVQALIEAAHAHAGALNVVAIGPLTNLATALARDPSVAGQIREIVLMGGSATQGNETAAAEFNIYADPEAARVVFDSGIPITMFGLHLCRQVLVGAEQVQALRDLATPVALLLADHLDAYVDIARKAGRSHMALYDPTTALWLLRPDLFELQDARVDIELDGRHTRGMTVCEFRVPARATANARLAMRADGPALLQAMLSQLAPALQANGAS